MPGLKPIHQQFAALPIIWASATARHDRARLLFPDIEIIEPPAPIAPHQHVHLHLGAHGKSALSRDDHLRDRVDTVRLAMLGKKAGLVITHQFTEEAFAEIPNVTVLHHGSVSGDDDFGDADAAFIIGGPHAPPSEITAIARAEAGCKVPYARPVRTPCAVLLEKDRTGGHTGIEIERLAYPDRRLQSVHEGIYDSAVVQAIGRARGINRSAETAVDIYVLANVSLPVPIASIERFRPPSRLDRMFLAGHVPTNAADMHRLYPNLFPSAEAARKARDGWGKGEGMRARIRELAHRAGTAWDTVLWQPFGQGHKSRISFVAHTGLAAAEAAARHEFPALVIWKHKPLTTGVGGGEDS